MLRGESSQIFHLTGKIVAQHAGYEKDDEGSGGMFLIQRPIPHCEKTFAKN